MDHTDDFWDPRKSFLPPIPELDEAADLLSEAADALLAGNRDLARDCLRRADIPVVRSFAYSIMGPQDPAIHRFRRVDAAVVVSKVSERMPTVPVEGAIFERDGWHCRFCGVRVVLKSARDIIVAEFPDVVRWNVPVETIHAAFYALSASLDHIGPHARGGNNDPGNIVTACWPCQFGRVDHLIEEVGLIDPRTRPPIVDDWDGLRRLLVLRRVNPRTPRPSRMGGTGPA